MEISATEIDLLCREISAATIDYSVSGVYSIENGLLLRLRHSSKQEILVAIASFATWLTSKNLALSEVSPFASRIRDYLERRRLTSVKQAGNERIARFHLTGRKDESYNLYAEFFAGGNQLVTSEAEDDQILEVARQMRFRHRTLARGQKYLLPPSRGIPLLEVDLESLRRLMRRDLEAGKSKISAIQWFGRNVGTSRKFVEEIFHRSETDAGVSIEDVKDSDLESLAGAASSLISEVVGSKSGHLLIPILGHNVSESKPSEDQQIEVDACAIIPYAWKVLERRGLALIRTFDSFNEALDEAQVQTLLFERKRKASIEARSKAAELESAIRKQDSLLEKNRKDSFELRLLSSGIMSGEMPEITEDMVKKLLSLRVLEADESVGGKLRFVSEPRSFLSTFSVRALASRLFEEAKKLEENNKRIEAVRKELVLQQAELQQQSSIQEDRAERKLNVNRRSKEWFERYRWFIASDGSLVIGGRDGTTNSVIINKYMDPNDIVFHADLYGSPFFVLKRRSATSLEVNDELAFEIAQATVSFSRAWKDELGSADAYWVSAAQVKKSAPSGEYLSRGSFFIEGKKNFVKHLKVELSVGLMSASMLPRYGESGNTIHKWNPGIEFGSHESSELTGHDEGILIVCGPERSISGYTIARIKIAPGKEKSSQVAKRIKQLLVGKVKDSRVKEITKRVPLDEIIRSLPAGNHKLVSEKQNR